MKSIVTQITMYDTSDGGRPCGFWSNYMPHLVSETSDDYLGVVAVGVTESNQVQPGTCREVIFDLMYADTIDYSSLKVGSGFQIREGAKSVGQGTVLEHCSQFAGTTH